MINNNIIFGPKLCFAVLAIIFLSLSLKISAQESPLNLTEYKLKNGLTVYLNEDHNQPKIFGCVVVKGGSKRDPKDATGIAHYFEHIMFKGTDQLGTTDYKSEKVYLDSIQMKYDELNKTTDENEREKIQIKINDLSLAAGDYAIPNEFDQLVAKMGGSDNNAATSEDAIYYGCTFAPDQVEKWIELFSNRFIHPVFRLFQAELETVYEEKNMDMDEPGVALEEEYMRNFYKKHPYGQQTVLGSIDHLKNPSLTKMEDYFNTYYVANNMALILIGDFNTEEIKPMIENKFGIWRKGEIPPMPDYNEEPFNGREHITRRLMPIRAGMIGFRTVPMGHPDEIALDVCGEILSNESQTGLLDKLYMDNKIMQAGSQLDAKVDNGMQMIFFIPKILGQSLRKAELLVTEQIEKLKKGEFDDELLSGIKINLKKSFEQSLENPEWRAYSIMDVFLEGKPWNYLLDYPAQVEKLTKEDIVRIANKYYNDNCLVLYSRMGFPKKEKLDKPPYKPVIPKNTEKHSAYALMIDSMKTIAIAPKFIEFNKDVFFKDLNPELHFYYTPNPINSIFSLRVSLGVGSYKYPVLPYSMNFLKLIGTENKSFEEFSKALQRLGAGFYCNSNESYTTINITGLEENLAPTLDLINELITKMKPDDKQLKKFYRESRLERKMEKESPWMKGYALGQYVNYKEESSYLKRIPLKNIKSLSSDTLIKVAKMAFNYETELHYCGKLPMDSVIWIINKTMTFPKTLIKSDSPVEKKRKNYTENTIYFVNDKKAIQSQISLFTEGGAADEKDRVLSAAFNEYFGAGSMGSIIFQELREFRSFAYSAYAYYMTPFHLGLNGYLSSQLSTQTDKTPEALKTLVDLITNMPLKPDRLDGVKQSIFQSINTERNPFRYLSYSVSNWRRLGYTEDPRKARLEYYKTMPFDEIVNFYKKNITDRKYSIGILGDEKRIDMQKIEAIGKVVEVKREGYIYEVIIAYAGVMDQYMPGLSLFT